MVVEELELEIKEEPIIRIQQNEQDVEKRIKCYGDTYKHVCPFGTKLKKNSTNINGTTDVECCTVDWEIIKVVVFTFFIRNIIYIYHMETNNWFINQESESLIIC